MTSPEPLLNDIVRESLSELLAFYLRDRVQEPRDIQRSMPSGNSVAASLGFTAPELRGSLVLVAAADMLATVLPPELAANAPIEDALADWSGELSNQLVGRIKNKLLKYGISVSLSVPTVFSAEALNRHRRRSTSPSSQHIQLTIAMEGFQTWVDVEVQSSVDFSIRHSVAPPLAEGELCLF